MGSPKAATCAGTADHSLNIYGDGDDDFDGDGDDDDVLYWIILKLNYYISFFFFRSSTSVMPVTQDHIYSINVKGQTTSEVRCMLK